MNVVSKYKEIETHRFAEKEILVRRIILTDGLVEDPLVVLETGLIQN